MDDKDNRDLVMSKKPLIVAALASIPVYALISALIYFVVKQF